MAAGASSRYGGCKLLAKIKEKPLLEYVVANAVALKPIYLAVVTGAWHEQIRAAQTSGILTRVPLLLNQGWQKGLGHSIAFGVSKLSDEVDKLLIVLADQVAITTENLQVLCAASGSAQISCAFYAGKRGVPAVFDKTCFKMLSQLEGDRGAKVLLYNPELDICDIQMPEAAMDIDTPEDLEIISETFC